MPHAPHHMRDIGVIQLARRFLRALLGSTKQITELLLQSLVAHRSFQKCISRARTSVVASQRLGHKSPRPHSSVRHAHRPSFAATPRGGPLYRFSPLVKQILPFFRPKMPNFTPPNTEIGRTSCRERG